MFGAFQTFGKLGAIGKAIAAAWSPLSLWPDGIATPGMWISPSLLTASFNDYLGTTPVATPGTVADSVNPVGLALDIRAGATTVSDPGNHMLQATSAARPLESARVNLLSKTEDFSDAYWTKGYVTVSANSTTAPDGTATADLIIEGAGSAYHYVQKSAPGYVAGVPYAAEVYAKYAGRKYVRLGVYNGVSTPFESVFDVQNGALGSYTGGGATRSIVSVGNGWYRLCVIGAANGSVAAGSFDIALQDADTSGPYVGDGSSGVYLWGAQLNTGSTNLPYQRVNTASDYTATGITPFQLYDGVDDGMATATFAAGTLTSSMDCLIAVRRDSAAEGVFGLYESPAGTKWFGLAQSGQAFTCFNNCGTPTVFVDAAQLSGGTGVTGDTLNTALTPGGFHILEFRGLNLSAWTAARCGLYTGCALNGARGDIMLYPSTTSTTDKDAARQYLADKYGVTLA